MQTAYQQVRVYLFLAAATAWCWIARPLNAQAPPTTEEHISLFSADSSKMSVEAERTVWFGRIREGLAARKEGRHTEAERLLLSALRQAEALDPQGAEVADSTNDLGAVYYSEGKYDDARGLFERSLAIRRKLGDSQPAIAQIEINLGEVDLAQGRYAHAEILLRKAHEIDERVSGRENLETASGGPGSGRSLHGGGKVRGCRAAVQPGTRDPGKTAWGKRSDCRAHIAEQRSAPFDSGKVFAVEGPARAGGANRPGNARAQ